jgi:hypothetical protein
MIVFVCAAFNHYMRAMYPEHFSMFLLKGIRIIYAAFALIVLFTPAI